MFVELWDSSHKKKLTLRDFNSKEMRSFSEYDFSGDELTEKLENAKRQGYLDILNTTGNCTSILVQFPVKVTMSYR
jgi:hypothetical protein